MTDKPIFVIIDTRGRAENLNLDMDWSWKRVLEHVYLIGMSAGGSTPMPKLLFRNGVKVADDLWSVAFKYGGECNKMHERMTAELSTKFPSPWKEARRWPVSG